MGPVDSPAVQGPDVLQLCARWRSGVSGAARDGRPAQRVTCISLLSGVSARECGVVPSVFTTAARKKRTDGRVTTADTAASGAHKDSDPGNIYTGKYTHPAGIDIMDTA